MAVLPLRCPHRLVRLDHGTLTRGRYHGWEFGPDGHCALVPSATPGLAGRAVGVKDEAGLLGRDWVLEVGPDDAPTAEPVDGGPPASVDLPAGRSTRRQAVTSA